MSKIRKEREEILCRQLLNYLIDIKQFPKALIVKERRISMLPNLIKKSTLHRRIDLLIYTPSLKPLLLIECKSIAITENAIRQIL